jgi:hypothetical protein
MRIVVRLELRWRRLRRRLRRLWWLTEGIA